MKRFVMIAVVMAAFMTFTYPAMAGQNTLRPEPPLNSQLAWDVYPNGMLVVTYDLDQNGRADYFTLRVIAATFVTRDSAMVVARNNAGSRVFASGSGGAIHTIYVTALYPLLYASDANEDGLWDVIYKDVSEDGVNGNEQFYGSPSGIYSLRIVDK